MKINVLLFAKLKERFGRDNIALELPDRTKACEVLNALCEDKEEAKRICRSVMFATNETYISSDTLLKDGDELAIIPPVSGG